MKLKRINLRWAMQLVWIILLAGLFLYLKAASPPFLAIASGSMEPTLSRGDLIFSSQVVVDDLKVGDIVVLRVPQQFQVKYGYPPSICHRIVRIQSAGDKLSFRTKGDATGEDPFMVTPESIQGKQNTAIPLIGYFVLFPLSSQGLIFWGGLTVLLLVYWNSSILAKTVKGVRSAVVGVSNSEFINSQKQLETKMDGMSGQVSQSMNNFATAMSEYAQHIASHTSAIKSLARVAEHLESVIPNLNYSTPPAGHPGPEYHYLEVQAPMPVQPIEVTPELKAAVKRFIVDYSRDHHMKTLEVTPELRTAVWEFIQKYVNEPLPRYSPDQTNHTQAISADSTEKDSSDSERTSLSA
jgi:signal peptidase I